MDFVGKWNILLSVRYFTNAGKAGHANLPLPTYDGGGKFVVPSMYVKDIIDAGAGMVGVGVPWGMIAGVDLPLPTMKMGMTKRSLTARKFYTEEVDLSKLLKGCRVVIHRNRIFVHRSTGALDIGTALEKTVNTGNATELVLSKTLAKQLVDFILWLNRVRGYGCCEFASLGSGWFAAQNIELLGSEKKGFADVKLKSKLFGARRYKREDEESRAIGTLRTGSMFEEYNSPNGSFDGPLEVVVRSKLYKILPDGIIASGSENSMLEKTNIASSEQDMDDISSLGHSSQASTLTTTIREVIMVLPDGSRHVTRTYENGATESKREGIRNSPQGRKLVSRKKATPVKKDPCKSLGLSDEESGRKVSSVYVPEYRLGPDRSSNVDYSPPSKSFGVVELGLVEINANGTDGVHGENGTSEANGVRNGDSGTNGLNGTKPRTCGGHASNVIINLRVLDDKKQGGISVVFIDPYDDTTKVRDELIFCLSTFPAIRVTAHGGRGGNGGSGGRGGDGFKGSDGDNATEVTNGTNGGHGGNGGDAGWGTSGTD